MRRWTGLGLAFLSCAAGCGPEILVGEYRDPSATGGTSSTGGTSPATGGTGGEGGVPFASPFPWSTSFETGDDSEFEAIGRARTLASGELFVGTEFPRTGEYALRARLVENSDQALELLEVPPNARVGAHYFIPADYDTQNWVLMKFRTREGLEIESRDVFDIDVNRVASGEYRVILWEHGPGEIAAADVTFRSETWVHLEAEFVASTSGEGGRLRVFQDGAEIIDTGLRETIDQELASTFAVGSVADWIEPLPADVWIDDVHVEELP